MKAITGCALAVLLLLSAAPSFAQGVTQSTPAPNSGNSRPDGTRTLAPGSTGTQQVRTTGTTRVELAPAQQ